MIKEIDKLRRLVAENKTDKALQILKEGIPAYPDLQNQVLVISAKFNDIRKKMNIGLMDDSESLKFQSQINFSVLELINEIDNANSSLPISVQQEKDDSIGEKKIKEVADASIHSLKDDLKFETVFISYNHHDTEIATKLKEKLTAEKINVVIDSERMQAGEDIKDFIEKCVRESGTTISIISKKSLLSAWVAMESINTFYHEKTDLKKKFIACYITDDFFKRNFTDETLDYIEGEIKEIQNLITARMEKNRSIRDLQNELTRMTELRNSIDEIIRRLRESLCVDIRDGNLESNFNKIFQAIHS